MKAAIRRIGPACDVNIVHNTIRIMEEYTNVDYIPAIRRINYFDYMDG